MKKIAIYGKGGIGKSTVTSNLSAALAEKGYKVMHIGCDPKADSTYALLGGKTITPVMDLLRDGTKPTLENTITQGFKGIYCIETGGPTPGIGCAGRGIIATFNILDELDVFGKLDPDIVFYDVLGDVVCGGFAAPIRENYANDVYIVTSGEKMSLFAAGNIVKAVSNFADRGYAQVKGLIMNRRNIDDESARVEAFADSVNVPITGDIPRSQIIEDYEDKGMTVTEGMPDDLISKMFADIAERMYANGKDSSAL